MVPVAARSRSPVRLVGEVVALGALVVLAVVLAQQGEDTPTGATPDTVEDLRESAPVEQAGPAASDVPSDPAAWSAMSHGDLAAVGRRVEEITPGFLFDRVEVFTGGGVTNSVAVFVHEQTELEFSLLPPGSFVMGEPASELGYSGRSQHRVTLTKPLLVARTECTQIAWERGGGVNLSNWRGPRLPVEMVSLDDVTAWCRPLGLRVPTEAEWEYACRAGTTTPFNVGEDITSDQVNFDGKRPYRGRPGKARERTVEVGRMSHNAFGLCDMHGNVWEWCQDVCVGYPTGEVTDPLVTEGADVHVNRGGSWFYSAEHVRSAYRNWYPAGERRDDFGFRPVRSVSVE